MRRGAGMHKKSMELTMNTIVIAAIVLIVLAILVIIFVGQIGEKSDFLRECESKGHVCMEKGECGISINNGYPGPYDCSEHGEDYVCCTFPFGEKTEEAPEEQEEEFEGETIA